MARYLLATIFICLLLVNSCYARHRQKNARASISQQSHKVAETMWGEIVNVDGGKAVGEKQGTMFTNLYHHRGGGVSEHRRLRRRLRRRRRSRGKRHTIIEAATVITSVEKKSVVSWHVPRKHQHEQLPGIYSDYPKPRSRPPSHN